MKILVLGGGQVGASVAEALAAQDHDTTIIDSDARRLSHLAEHLKLRTIVGNAAWPSTLRKAGAEDADLLIAVTQSDETNLVACKLAKSVFNVPTRIARLRYSEFHSDENLLSDDNFAVDHALCPEELVTAYIARLVTYPEALQVVDFADGRVTLVCVPAYEGGLLVGRPLRAMREHFPIGIEARIPVLYRRGRPLLPNGDTVVEHGDEVFILAATEMIRPALRELRRLQQPVRRIMIAGGGHIGMRVAKRLERNFEVKIIEGSAVRAEHLANVLDDALVLVGDATDEELLAQENIGEMDLFLSLTNDDEVNIMAATLAKQRGCQRVIALINRRAYADMVQGGPIDIGLSPAQISIGALLAHVRRGDVARVHSLRRGAIEALEIVAHGDAGSSQVIGRRIGEIPWPKGVAVAAIVRHLDRQQMVGVTDAGAGIWYRGDVVTAHHDTVIEPEDHVIVLCLRRRLVRQVEQLFQVSCAFI